MIRELSAQESGLAIGGILVSAMLWQTIVTASTPCFIVTVALAADLIIGCRDLAALKSKWRDCDVRMHTDAA